MTKVQIENNRDCGMTTGRLLVTGIEQLFYTVVPLNVGYGRPQYLMHSVVSEFVMWQSLVHIL